MLRIPCDCGARLKLPPVTEVPRAPNEIIGVVSVRGLLVTVIDLKRRLRVTAVRTGRSCAP